jgi:general stress protein 26
MNSELDKVLDMLHEIDTAMLVTRRSDGHLVSRAMATQERAPGADIWFVTAEGSGKLTEIAADPHVNLTYYNESTREWLSVSGTAVISRDRATIRTLYRSDWSIWFPADEADRRYGTADDPRMVLIGVSVAAATYLEVNKPRPVVLFEIVKGWLTGAEPQLGETHHVSARE